MQSALQNVMLISGFHFGPFMRASMVCGYLGGCARLVLLYPFYPFCLFYLFYPFYWLTFVVSSHHSPHNTQRRASGAAQEILPKVPSALLKGSS